MIIFCSFLEIADYFIKNRTAQLTELKKCNNLINNDNLSTLLHLVNYAE